MSVTTPEYVPKHFWKAFARFLKRHDSVSWDRTHVLAPTTETELLRTAVGTFDVHSQLWPSEGAEPIVTDAVARRRMVEDLYLEEIMEPGAGAPEPFSRICYLDFNPLSRRWEYVSLDTRIPAQLMYEISNDHTLGDQSTVVLHLPTFALPGWGTEVTGSRSAKGARSPLPIRTTRRCASTGLFRMRPSTSPSNTDTAAKPSRRHARAIRAVNSERFRPLSIRDVG